MAPYYQFMEQSLTEKLCRTCLRMPEKLFSLFEDQKLGMMIKTISNIQVSLVDQLPKGICQECMANVKLAFNFRTVIINSNVDLQDRLKYLVNKTRNQNRTANFLKRETNAMTTHTNTLEDDLRINDTDSVVKTEDNTYSIVNEDSNNCSDMQQSAKPISKLQNTRELKEKRKLYIHSSSCGFQTTDYNERRRHALTHNKNNFALPIKVYKCRQCGLKSANWSAHNRHKNTHVRIRMRVCNICGISCRAENLYRHMETHNVGASVSCDLCGKMFKNKESMRPHMRVHDGKLYKCDICGVVHKYASAFARHKQKHFPEKKKLKCTLCDKRFFAPRYLKLHMQVHTGERPYECTICQQRLSSRYALKTHQRQHTKEKPFVCEYCSTAFRQKCSLRAHIASKHSSSSDNQVVIKNIVRT